MRACPPTDWCTTYMATQGGEQEAKDTGEDAEDCIIAQKQRIGRRIARQVWRDIHEHSRARRQFAGASPPPDQTRRISQEARERRLEADDVKYRRAQRLEREQEESMRVRRDNERYVYARGGEGTGRTFGGQCGRGRESAGGRPWIGRL